MDEVATSFETRTYRCDPQGETAIEGRPWWRPF
jgi:hypothetical protein